MNDSPLHFAHLAPHLSENRRMTRTEQRDVGVGEHLSKIENGKQKEKQQAHIRAELLRAGSNARNFHIRWQLVQHLQKRLLRLCMSLEKKL